MDSKVHLCPECGNACPLPEGRRLALPMEQIVAVCLECGWTGSAQDLIVPASGGVLSDPKLLQNMVDDLRNVLAQDMAKVYGRFLMRWGFIGANVSSRELSRYIVAIAKATMKAIIETRIEIVEERNG